MNTIDHVLEHLRTHAGRYFATWADAPSAVNAPSDAAHSEEAPHLTLQRVSPRLFSDLLRLEYVHHRRRCGVIVKAPRHDAAASYVAGNDAAGDRPRMGPPLASGERLRLENQTMCLVAEHFGRLADDRFGAVKMLDRWQETGAMVMQEVREPTLRQWLWKAHRLRRWRLPSALFQGVCNAGAWLREYHHMPPLPHAQTRHAVRSDFTNAARRFTDYLQQQTGQTAYFQRRGEQIESLAQAFLPQEMPLGNAHGDFAPRNLFLDPSGRVTVIDAIGRWRAPVYEDIGDFLANLKSSGPQNLSLQQLFHARTFASLERQFLTGYFDGEPIPWGAVRLFEIRALLARWSSAVHASHSAQGWRRIVRWCNTRAYRRQIDHLFDELGSHHVLCLAGTDLRLP